MPPAGERSKAFPDTGEACYLLGRAYTLAAWGEAGVSHLLELIAADMRVTMTLIGANSPAEINQSHLDAVVKELKMSE